MGIREGRFEVEEGIRLYYRILGEGVSTVLVPNAVWLEKVLEPLAEGRTLVLYDLRSRGRSDRVEEMGRLGIEQDVADLEAVRRHLGIERAAVLGHSYPATVAALYALEHPARVSRLVLVGAMPPRRLPYFAQGFAPAEALLRPTVKSLEEMRAAGNDRIDPPAFARAWMREFMLPMQVADRASVDRIPLDACEHPNEWPEHFIRGFVERILPSLGDWDYRERLASLQVPTLVVHGAKERLPVEGAREWAAAIPGARLLVVDGSGHYPMVERPEIFFPAVERFLEGDGPDGAETPR